MEEKISNMLSFLDDTAQKIRQTESEWWTKTTEIARGIRVKTITRPLNRWGRIKQHIYTRLEYPRLLLRSQDPLWSILDGDSCRLLAALNNSDTYKQCPPQELQIVSAHQELSKSECIGSVEVYHKGQLISQSQWHLKLSGGRAILKASFPSAIHSALAPSLKDWYTLTRIS